MYAPTAREIVAIDPAGERMTARQEIIETQSLIMSQLHRILCRQHNPANRLGAMPPDGMIYLLNRIRIEKHRLIHVKVALTPRKRGGERCAGRRKIFTYHVKAERLNDSHSRIFLRVQIPVPVGVEKKFIQVNEANPIGASPAFVPADFKNGQVRVEVRRPAVPPDWPDLDFGRSAQNFHRPIGRIIVIDYDPLHERLIMLKKERDNPFLISTSLVKIDGHKDGSQHGAYREPVRRIATLQHIRSEKSAQKPRGRRILFMRSSTKDKIKGSLLEAKGKVKEGSGKAVGNPDLRDRGTGEKVAGKVQKKVGDIKKVFGN